MGNSNSKRTNQRLDLLYLKNLYVIENAERFNKQKTSLSLNMIRPKVFNKIEKKNKIEEDGQKMLKRFFNEEKSKLGFVKINKNIQNLEEYENELFYEINKYRKFGRTDLNLSEDLQRDFFDDQSKTVFKDFLIERSIKQNLINSGNNHENFVISFLINEAGSNITNAEQFSDYCFVKIENNCFYDTSINDKNFKKCKIFVGKSDIDEFVVVIVLGY